VKGNHAIAWGVEMMGHDGLAGASTSSSTITKRKPDEDVTGAPVSILIVDDHVENAVALRAILGMEDYRIVEVHSGAEALKRMLREDFALVLLDVRMPIMDGFEVAALMRTRERTRSVPILFLTGEALDHESVYRGYTAGAVDYLLKPLDPFVVRAKVAVFAELYRQKNQIRRQAEMLMQSERKDHELAVAELKLANELQQKALLKEALRIRDEFLSLASHELKTPLTPLLSHLQVLLRAVREGQLTPERAKKSLDVAVHQAHKLSRLIDQLLDVARIEGGRFSLTPEEVDLTELVGKVVDHYTDEAAKMGSDLRFTASGPVRGFWDRLRIEQVVTNLITNALKFGQGKPIEVEVSSSPRESHGAKCNWAKLLVRDHGVGIALGDTDRIFDRFERAVNVSHYGGLGLGLYIVRQIVDAHGGGIHVTSRPGSGATFVVELPQTEPPNGERR